MTDQLHPGPSLKELWCERLERSDLPATVKHVGLSLARTAWPDGSNAEATVRELAARCSRKQQTVVDAIERLVDDGWLDRSRPDRRSSARYRLLPAEPVDNVASAAPPGSTTGSSATPRGSTQCYPDGQHSDGRVLPLQAAQPGRVLPQEAALSATPGGSTGGDIGGEEVGGGSSTPPTPPRIHRQLPMVAAVRDPDPDPAEVALNLARQVGLPLRRCPDQLAAAVAEAFEDGWTPATLARCPTIVGQIPTEVPRPVGFLLNRFALLKDLEPPKPRRTATHLEVGPPLEAPGLPPGRTVTLDELQGGA